MKAREVTPAAWWPVWAVLALALVLRVAFYSGFFGSDEVTYVEWAFKLLDGDWSVSDYVGANRYGMNLPMAMFGWMFGRNEWAAAAYPMICAVAEVALVAVVGQRLVGERAALLAALILACLPMHVHFAGRLMADTPLTLAITASFLYFFDGELRQRGRSFFIAGCAAGLSFWIKQAAIVYLAVFLLYPLFARRLDLRWGWMALGFALVVLANCLLFHALTGDAMYIFKAMESRRSSGYLGQEAAAGALLDSPWIYPSFLFVKLHHTWILGYLAAIGLGVWLVHRRRQPAIAHDRGLKLLAFWAVAMIAVLSLLVVQVRPLMFVPKQTNYMLMFAAPLCLLAGHALAKMDATRLRVVLVLVIAPSVLLSLLHQTTVQVFTANSKAAVRFAAAHPNARVFANSNPYRAAVFQNLVHPSEVPVRIGSMSTLLNEQAHSKGSDGVVPPVFAVLDQTTLAWAGSEPIRRLQDVPPCWVKQQTLEPALNGFGSFLRRSLASDDVFAGDGIGGFLLAKLRAQFVSAPAVVFLVPPDCH